MLHFIHFRWCSSRPLSDGVAPSRRYCHSRLLQCFSVIHHQIHSLNRKLCAFSTIWLKFCVLVVGFQCTPAAAAVVSPARGGSVKTRSNTYDDATGDPTNLIRLESCIEICPCCGNSRTPTPPSYRNQTRILFSNFANRAPPFTCKLLLSFIQSLTTGYGWLLGVLAAALREDRGGDALYGLHIAGLTKRVTAARPTMAVNWVYASNSLMPRLALAALSHHLIIMRE